MNKNKKFLEKRIQDLKGYTFEIPEYQRGYRWETSQVRDLLNDMYDFFKRKNDDNEQCYYLQPIIIKKEQKNKFTLIDGQQRLTTIYMILKYINIKYKQYNAIYEIMYKTIEEDEKEFSLERKIDELINNCNHEEKNI